MGLGEIIRETRQKAFLNRKNLLKKEEIERLKEQRECEINASLVKLNNDIYQAVGISALIYQTASQVV